MGKPVKIKELAQRMIELSGLTVRDEDHPHGEIEIMYTGLLPGEKLYEELLIGNNQSPTEHRKIINANENFISWSNFQSIVDSLKKAINHGDIDLVIALMKKNGIDYSVNNLVVDFMYDERKKMTSSQKNNTV
jgi:FlaA1/EpsC-like NDP-sugar epimerase